MVGPPVKHGRKTTILPLCPPTSRDWKSFHPALGKISKLVFSPRWSQFRECDLLGPHSGQGCSVWGGPRSQAPRDPGQQTHSLKKGRTRLPRAEPCPLPPLPSKPWGPLMDGEAHWPTLCPVPVPPQLTTSQQANRRESRRNYKDQRAP